jgi:hypothetical protein
MQAKNSLHMCKAVVRNPAPAFKASAWYQDKIQTISLD